MSKFMYEIFLKETNNCCNYETNYIVEILD